jgi:uncharacterized protein YheU (UPF0270 family)
MASYKEIATLASDINTRLDTTIQPDTLVYLIETFIEDEDTPFTEVPIGEITEQVHSLLLLADAVLIAQDGEDIETIEREVAVTAKFLGVKE